MKIKEDNLPESLKQFLETGQTLFRGDDGDWEVEIESVMDTPYKEDVPSDSLIIANNGCGDFLFIRKISPDTPSYAPEVYVYWHEEHRHEAYSDDIKNLTNPEPAKPSQHKTIFYYGGTVEVNLGDEVSARNFLFRRNVRIAYLPGVSRRNRNMEYGGLSWVGIKFQRGTFVGVIVDPKTFQLKKSVRFIQRSSEKIDELGPDEDFE